MGFSFAKLSNDDVPSLVRSTLDQMQAAQVPTDVFIKIIGKLHGGSTSHDPPVLYTAAICSPNALSDSPPPAISETRPRTSSPKASRVRVS